MKRRWLMMLAVGLMLAADDAKSDANKKEIKAFEGTWKWVSLEINGKEQPADLFKGSRLIITGDKFASTEGEETLHGTFKVDVAKKPMTVDVTFNDGPDKGKTLQGIYELTGDTYKVCMGLPGKKRPTEFVTKPDSGHVLEVLKRQKR